MHIESLESRRLLAGVTLLIHGHEGAIDGWVEAAANAIAKRAGSAQTSQYVMKIGANIAGQLGVTSFKLEKGPALNNSSNAESVILVDWTAVDNGSKSTKSVGKVVADYITRRQGSMRALSELPIHMIGHSRGASMTVAISAQLALRGIWVDQLTFLDPHPVDGGIQDGFADYDDAEMKVWDNVIFADNYWREDGLFNFDPDGEAVGGAHNLKLNNSVQENHVVSAHLAVTSYYHGTIDLSATHNKDNPIPSSWYGNSSVKPGRDQTGYLFSRIGGGKRPADGLAPEFGGTASRNSASPGGAQTPNVTHIRALDGRSFASGTRLSLRFVWQDRDGRTDFNVFLDPDTNPYNGNNVKTMRRVTLDDGADVTGARISALTDGVRPGKYYIGIQSSDAQGQVRINYSAQVTVTAAVSRAAAFSDTRIAPENSPTSSSATKLDRIAEQVLV